MPLPKLSTLLIRTALLLVSLVLFPGLVWSASAPRVVASIPPLHSLAAAVMGGSAEPALLVSGGASPHNYALRPSEARLLSDADLIIWTGPNLESFLAKPLVALGSKAHVLTLTEATQLSLHPLRDTGLWEEEEHGDGRDHHHGDGGIDPHLWLDPDNARQILALIRDALSELDPGNAEHYRENAAAAAREIDALDGELRTALAPLKDVPYVVFHDAYQYLERHYELNALGAITLSPDRRPGLRTLRQIRERIEQTGAGCVFSEPQFDAKLVESLLAGTGIDHAPLDPLGMGIEPGPDAYLELMGEMGRALQKCLSGGRWQKTESRVH